MEVQNHILLFHLGEYRVVDGVVDHAGRAVGRHSSRIAF